MTGHFQFNPLCCRITQKNLTIPYLAKAAEITGQLGEELAFVAPNQDAGLLPINRCVMDLEELAERDIPPSVSAGLKVARGWLDKTLDGPGKFTEETIRDFNGWHAWMTSVLLAWERGTDMPAWPEGWDADHPAAAGAEVGNTVATASTSGGEELPIHLNLAEDLEFLREFHGESVELLQDIEQGILVLEDNPTDAGYHLIRFSAPFTLLRVAPASCISRRSVTLRMIWNRSSMPCDDRSCASLRKLST